MFRVLLIPEAMIKDVRCIKYEKKKQKSREVSEVVSSVDPTSLQELRDEIAAAKSTADEAEATANEAKKESADQSAEEDDLHKERTTIKSPR
jgi:hypothetical protein